MKAEQSFQLIDGSFSPQQAREILGAMIRHKIDYHSREKFSNSERFGEIKSCNEKRFKSLQLLEKQLMQALQEAEKSGKSLIIEGVIKIIT